jgi:hypothetical protein
LSAAATFSAKTLGVTNWAFLPCRSASATPRAAEHFPQTQIGTRASKSLFIISISGGMATG